MSHSQCSVLSFIAILCHFLYKYLAFFTSAFTSDFHPLLPSVLVFPHMFYQEIFTLMHFNWYTVSIQLNPLNYKGQEQEIVFDFSLLCSKIHILDALGCIIGDDSRVFRVFRSFNSRSPPVVDRVLACISIAVNHQSSALFIQNHLVAHTALYSFTVKLYSKQLCI